MRYNIFSSPFSNDFHFLIFLHRRIYDLKGNLSRSFYLLFCLFNYLTEIILRLHKGNTRVAILQLEQFYDTNQMCNIVSSKATTSLFKVFIQDLANCVNKAWYVIKTWIPSFGLRLSQKPISNFLSAFIILSGLSGPIPFQTLYN